MSITIHDAPSVDYMHPSYNKVEFLVSGTNYLESNYKVQVKIYRFATGSTPDILKFDPYPGESGKCIADISKIIRDYTYGDLSNKFNSTLPIADESTFYERFLVTFQEYYSNPSSGAPTLQGSPSSGSVFTAWNGSYKYRDWIADTGILTWSDIGENPVGHTYDNYIWLTRFNNQAADGLYVLAKKKKILIDQDETIYFKSNQLTVRVLINIRDEDYNHLYLGKLELTSGNAKPRVFSLNINPGSLSSKTYYDGSIGAVAANWKYMTVRYASTNNASDSTMLVYEIDHTPCDRFKSYEIHWLNSLGGIDTWIFNKRSRISDETNRTTYVKAFNPINGASISNNSHSEMMGTTGTTIETLYQCNSGILKDWENDGLSDLINSPLVYWNSPDYGYVQIEITRNNFEYKQQAHDKAYNLTIDFKIKNNDTRQQR